MSIITNIEPGTNGTPAHVTFRVSAIGSTDAATEAKRQAREDGWRTKTLIGISLVGPSNGSERTAVRDWLVTLAARPPVTV
jgi:hypothetical protein